MTEVDRGIECFACPTDTDDYQAVGVGPGLGKADETEAALLAQIDICQTPMVIDADALNLLAEHRTYIGRLPKGSILTPHPGELERLVGKCQDSYERLIKACDLAKTAGVYIVLKGAYSTIITPEGKCFFNTTGNPGMATGGSGDVLTGIILALLAQNFKAEDAACLGVYVHVLVIHLTNTFFLIGIVYFASIIPPGVKGCYFIIIVLISQFKVRCPFFFCRVPFRGYFCGQPVSYLYSYIMAPFIAGATI